MTRIEKVTKCLEELGFQVDYCGIDKERASKCEIKDAPGCDGLTIDLSAGKYMLIATEKETNLSKARPGAVTIKSDGTTTGTILIDENGNKLGLVKRFMVSGDANEPTLVATIEFFEPKLELSNVQVANAKETK